MYKKLKKMEKRMMGFFEDHPSYNAFTHTFIGVGIGVLLTYLLVTVTGTYTFKWGLLILAAGILMHLYPLVGE